MISFPSPPIVFNSATFVTCGVCRIITIRNSRFIIIWLYYHQAVDYSTFYQNKTDFPSLLEISNSQLEFSRISTIEHFPPSTHNRRLYPVSSNEDPQSTRFLFSTSSVRTAGPSILFLNDQALDAHDNSRRRGFQNPEEKPRLGFLMGDGGFKETLLTLLYIPEQ
jgi:hypothetical protein